MIEVIADERAHCRVWVVADTRLITKATRQSMSNTADMTIRFAAPGTSVRRRVRIDGQPLAAAHGIDIDEQGHGAVTEQRLHQLIRQPGPIADRRFEIEFLDAGVGVRIYVRVTDTIALMQTPRHCAKEVRDLRGTERCGRSVR